jgi:hypothetical protein
MIFLERKVNFQGTQGELSNIVKTGDVRLLNTLDCDSISLLLENGKPSIHIFTVDRVKCYIDITPHLRKLEIFSL